MKIFQAFVVIGGMLCMSAQAVEPLHTANVQHDGASSWHNSFPKSSHNHTNVKAHKLHHNQTKFQLHEKHFNGTDYHRHLNKRLVIETIYPQDTGDGHYYVALWKDLDCKNKPFRDFNNLNSMSSGCQVIPDKATSFALKGNVKDCAHFWYWDTECSDPAELNAVFGDVWCYNGPGAPGHEQIGSYKIICKDST